MHRFTELEEGLVFDPAGLICQTALQEVQTSYQFIGLSLLDLVEEVREELYAYASHAPNTVRGKSHVGGENLREELRIVYVLRDGEQARQHLLLNLKERTVHECSKASVEENHALFLREVVSSGKLFDEHEHCDFGVVNLIRFFSK